MVVASTTFFWGEGQRSNDTGFSDFPFYLSYLRYDFGKGRVGKRHQVEFTLYNQGDIPATARFDAWILPKNGRHLGFGCGCWDCLLGGW